MAELEVPYVLMHMRGDAATMSSPENTAYGDVCVDVAAELRVSAEAAISAGIEPWRIILDPGGPPMHFSKFYCVFLLLVRIERGSEGTKKGRVHYILVIENVDQLGEIFPKISGRMGCHQN